MRREDTHATARAERREKVCQSIMIRHDTGKTKRRSRLRKRYGGVEYVTRDSLLIALTC